MQLAGAVVIQMVVGILFIYSSGINSNGVQSSQEFLRQIVQPNPRAKL